MSLLRLLNLQFTIPGNDEFLGIVFFVKISVFYKRLEKESEALDPALNVFTTE